MSEAVTRVIGPMGELLEIDDLPQPEFVRWTPRRNAEVVAAVRGGLLTFDEACARYSLAMDELIAWQGAFERSGVAALRTTQLQYYRGRYDRQRF